VSEYISADGLVKVDLGDLGEGRGGDYDDEDPEDEPVLRFTVSRFYRAGEEVEVGYTDWLGDRAEEDGWQAVSAASYCTRLGADLPQEVQDRAGRYLLARVEDDVRQQRPVNKLCEDLSWIKEGRLMPGLTDRELATVLAALRHWQAHLEARPPDGDGRALLAEVASNAGAFRPLTPAEVDGLCERLNLVPLPPGGRLASPPEEG
jgi:hypothetical protein